MGSARPVPGSNFSAPVSYPPWRRRASGKLVLPRSADHCAHGLAAFRRNLQRGFGRRHGPRHARRLAGNAGGGRAFRAQPGPAMTGRQLDHLPRRLWWILAGLSLAWGFNWTAMKVSLSEVAPWTFRSLCLGLGSAVLFMVLRAGGQDLAVPKGQRLRLAMLAFFNITCWNLLVAFGLLSIPSGRAAILAYMMPAWAIPLSIWIVGE